MKSKEPNGVVIETLPNLTYRVEMNDGKVLMAYMAGKMKIRKIGISVGDRVEVVVDPHGGKATNRIVWRF
jgi:translation initiation factor IF-1